MTDSPEEWPELAEKYRESGSLTKVADVTGIAVSTVRWRLKKMGVELNAAGSKGRHKTNILTGEQCRIVRQELGLSQAKLASEANCAPRTICLFEQGKRTPTDETQRKLKETLGLLEAESTASH
ncbi:helix-turn-helix domain-containing protein [Celeribacter naphthalenivorans]|uniref:helix-turn-helix domain-containing protein n=1 Tax=Celeribacter naphthalenivorans TaxID=1614694 RepID=UPI001CFB9641|nr:helix-turn-helix transcriptional regulator [Celeribacter naphthalenivorans]